MFLVRRRLLRSCHSSSFPKSIAPLPANTTHHQVLGIPENKNPFVIDLADLKNRFRAAQASVHPDVWAAKSPVRLSNPLLDLLCFIVQREQDLAHTLSSRVNEAYQTLLNPLARAEYILQLNGHPMSEHDQVHDLEFMATIMDARELIEGAEDPSSLEQLVRRNNG